jgi:beta-glucosidase
MQIFKLLLVYCALLMANAIDVKNLLSKMTPEDKCGQMTQILLGVVEKDSNDPTYSENPIDLVKLRSALKEFRIGSILGIPYGTPKLKEWHKVIKLVQDIALNETSHRIPIIYGTDSIHGAFIDNGVLFPHQLSMAASFNLELVGKIAAVIAHETRATGVPWNFSPILDIGRQPLWPRLYETFGEDVHLASKMAEVFIKSHQGDDLKSRKTAANCLKHYVGYSYPFNGRDRSVAWIPEILLREMFLPSFESGVRAGALTVMINSGDVNGVPGHANYHYLTTILKGEWNFTGFAVSDFEDVKRLHTRDKIAKTPEDAVYIAVMAGVDMSMVPDDYSFYGHCVNLTRKKTEFLKRVDDAAFRILYVKNELGLFEDAYPHGVDDEIGTQENEDLSLVAAQESIILAKNLENILPFRKDMKILVTGPTSNLMNVLNSGWSYSWQGDNEDDFDKYGRKKLTILAAIRNRTSNSQIFHVPGASFDNILNINATIEAAQESDAIILCIGEVAYAETPGNIGNLMISVSQLTLARELFKLNKKIVVVYVGGRPRTITEIVEHSAAVIVSFLPGNRGGEAIADALFGNFNPSAKFPITYNRDPNGYMTYDFKPVESPYESGQLRFPDHYDPLFKFGHGLSYTVFEFSRLVLDSENVEPPNGIRGSVNVKNVGKRAGQEVVIVYLNDEYSHIARPVVQMKMFKKINLQPNEDLTVDFEISLKDMSFVDMQNRRVYEQGKFNVFVSHLNATFNLECKKKICEY